MARQFTVACIQNAAGSDRHANLADIDTLLDEALRAGADLLCLAEYATFLHVGDGRLEAGAQPEAGHPALAHLRRRAKDAGVWLLAGSIAVDVGSGRFRNRSYLLDSDGEIVARYDKIHMFDVELPGGEVYRESDFAEPGDSAVVAPTPWGLLGMSVCYDLRFPQLYRALAQAGATFLTVPAAFTKTTGRAHWHTLLRARAIETGSFVFAPGQHGSHGDAETYGRSLIVDPWGKVLAEAGDDRAVIAAQIDVDKVAAAHNAIPALRHDRAFAAPELVAPSRVATGGAHRRDRGPGADSRAGAGGRRA